MNAAEIRAALERHWSDITDQEVAHEIYHFGVVPTCGRCGRSIRQP
jgi:hypothetical protein